MYAETLNIFPSQPMHVEPSTKVGVGLVPPSNSPKTSQEPTMELGHPRRIVPALPGPGKDVKAAVNKTGTKKGGTSSSEHEGPKTPDPKAYVQQLESSRIKLTQLEQELQRARSQGVLLGGSIHSDQAIPGGIACISSESAMFDMEYGRWVEEHHRLMCELRAAVQEHLPENDLRMFVESCLSHYDELALPSRLMSSTSFRACGRPLLIVVSFG